MIKNISIAIILLICSYTMFAIEFVKIKPEKASNLKNFYIAKYPVNQKEYFDIMGHNPSLFQGDNLPVERISWYEALVFCNKLSLKDNLEPVYILRNEKNPDLWGPIPNHRMRSWTRIKADSTANGYRLPYHNEWQFIFNQYFGKFDLDENFYKKISKYAWTHINSEMQTQPIGSKKADKFGLYDFLGNVLEWRFDHYGSLSLEYFNYSTTEDEIFYSCLSYNTLKLSNFSVLKDRRGLYPVLKNSQIGIRLAKNCK